MASRWELNFSMSFLTSPEAGAPFTGDFPAGLALGAASAANMLEHSASAAAAISLLKIWTFMVEVFGRDSADLSEAKLIASVVPTASKHHFLLYYND
jgi:hypothetical protein